jgi:hypothetical protein
MRPTLAVIIPVGDDIGSLPGFGGGWGSGNRPDNSLPGYGHPGGGPIYHPGHPDHGLPSGPPDHAWWGGGRPDRPGNDLPWAPVHPGNRPPGSGGGHPGNRPPGSWGGRPDQGLPGEQPGIDNSLPGGWGRPDQGLPGPQRDSTEAAGERQHRGRRLGDRRCQRHAGMGVGAEARISAGHRQQSAGRQAADPRPRAARASRTEVTPRERKDLRWILALTALVVIVIVIVSVLWN